MNGPYRHQIPNLNMLLGAFDSWGVGRWATIQDVVVRSSIGLDRTESKILAQYLLDDGYIKRSKKISGYNLAQIPGQGMVDVPINDDGYELTPKGKQFHLDGGYRLDQILSITSPNTKPSKTNKSQFIQKKKELNIDSKEIALWYNGWLFKGIVLAIIALIAPLVATLISKKYDSITEQSVTKGNIPVPVRVLWMPDQQGPPGIKIIESGDTVLLDALILETRKSLFNRIKKLKKVNSYSIKCVDGSENAKDLISYIVDKNGIVVGDIWYGWNPWRDEWDGMVRVGLPAKENPRTKNLIYPECWGSFIRHSDGTYFPFYDEKVPDSVKVSN